MIGSETQTQNMYKDSITDQYELRVGHLRTEMLLLTFSLPVRNILSVFFAFEAGQKARNNKDIRATRLRLATRRMHYDCSL
jgi:hypothetical protein